MSTDLVHWERLPPALIPDTEYDYDGVFSGSTTLLEDGTPAIFFTGVCLPTIVRFNSIEASNRRTGLPGAPLLDVIAWLSAPDALTQTSALYSMLIQKAS